MSDKTEASRGLFESEGVLDHVPSVTQVAYQAIGFVGELRQARAASAGQTSLDDPARFGRVPPTA